MNNDLKKRIIKSVLIILFLGFCFYIYNRTDKVWVKVVALINVSLGLYAYIKINYMQKKTK